MNQNWLFLGRSFNVERFILLPSRAAVTKRIPEVSDLSLRISRFQLSVVTKTKVMKQSNEPIRTQSN